MARTIRIGQIVPSSNTTMEAEIPAMLRAREAIAPERFTFHSSRMRMRQVTKEELAGMDGQAARCAVELADARVDVMGYACLVAIMAAGHGYHRAARAKLEAAAAEAQCAAPVVTSAGALLDGLRILGAKRIAVIAPYHKSLADLVVDYIEAEGVTVKDRIALEVTDNLAVGMLDPANLPEHARQLDIRGCDALVLSACVQMPSLPSIALVEKQVGIPVVSAATCTTHAMLTALGLEPVVPDAGALLSGRHRAQQAA
jgi:maleate isomerase